MQFLIVAIILFIIWGVLINIFRYRKLYSKKQNHLEYNIQSEEQTTKSSLKVLDKTHSGYNIQSEERTIRRSLKVLDKNHSGKIKARAFIRLMECAYVSIHVLINSGNNYNDKAQSIGFCNSLSNDLIKKLYSLEGRRG